MLPCCNLCVVGLHFVPEHDVGHWCAEMEFTWNEANLRHLAVAEAHPFAAFVGTQGGSLASFWSDG